MVKIAVSGALGRMGKRIIDVIQKDDKAQVVFGLEASNNPGVGSDWEGVKILGDPTQVKDCDCLIDFTVPDATIANLKYLVENKTAAVIGTTGLTDEQIKAIELASKSIPIVFSPNMSVGVNVLFNLLASAAKALKGYEINVEESHHIHKKDSPSGTAKKLVDIINDNGFTVKYEEVNAIREGEIIGDHKIVFESSVDRIELSHHAKTRDIFAQGAVVAAKWLVGKSAGLYSMNDVLAL